MWSLNLLWRQKKSISWKNRKSDEDKFAVLRKCGQTSYRCEWAHLLPDHCSESLWLSNQESSFWGGRVWMDWNFATCKTPAIRTRLHHSYWIFGKGTCFRNLFDMNGAFRRIRKVSKRMGILIRTFFYQNPCLQLTTSNSQPYSFVSHYHSSLACLWWYQLRWYFTGLSLFNLLPWRSCFYFDLETVPYHTTLDLCLLMFCAGCPCIARVWLGEDPDSGWVWLQGHESLGWWLGTAKLWRSGHFDRGLWIQQQGFNSFQISRFFLLMIFDALPFSFSFFSVSETEWFQSCLIPMRFQNIIYPVESKWGMERFLSFTAHRGCWNKREVQRRQQ